MVTRPRRVLFYGVMIIVLGWGVYVRVAGVNERPFSCDEAWVAYAATHQSYGELLCQTELPMPPLFAVSAKLLGSIVSPPELGLRLLPLACGIACVPLSYLTLRTLRVPRTIALAAMALCASGLMPVIWSRELKHYQLEAFFSVLLALVVFRIRRGPGPRRRWLMRVAIVLICLLGPWFGYATVFPALTLMAVLIMLHPVAGKRQESLISGLVGLAVLAASTGAVLRLGAAEQASHPALMWYTSRWFVDPLDADDWARAARHAAVSTTTIFFPEVWMRNRPSPEQVALFAGLAVGIWVLALIALCWWPGRGRLEMACWVFVPWFLMLVAAIAGRYPFAQPRMMAFWAAPMVLATGVGLVRVGRGCSVAFLGRGGPGIIAGLILMLGPVLYIIKVPTQHHYWAYHDFPAVLEVLHRERRAGELVVVAAVAAPCVRYYIDETSGPPVYMPTAAGVCYDSTYDYEALIAKTVGCGGSRWWVLTISWPDWPDPWRDKLLATAQQHGYEIEVVAEGGKQRVYGVAQLLALTRRHH